MKIAFDASTAAFQRKTGTGVYCEELIRAYQESFPEDQIVHTYRLSRRVRGWEHLLPMTDNASREVLVDPWTYFKGARYDVFHGLNSRLPLLARSKMVATIHDLFSIFGEFSRPEFREDQTKKLLQMIARADHIIVPAGFTKQQLSARLHVPAEKISVVKEGVREVYLRAEDRELSAKRVRQIHKIENPFVLFVGTLEKRKNVVGCIKAYMKFKSTHPNPVDLVLVGHAGYGFEEIKREIESATSAGGTVRVMGFVGDESLADLYRASRAFLFLSWEEGFGIPVIEAMACGTPVISSDTTSLPEVCGGHAWLVGPGDPAAAAAALGQIFSDAPADRDCVKARISGAQEYSRALTWAEVARETRQIYSTLLS